MIRLRAEGIGKSYGAVRALDAIDLDIHAGAVNVLIGENGAGKSTLMKIIAGIEQPSAGRLLLDGRAVAFASVRDAAACGIGIVHQELNLCPNLTVADNICLTDVGTRHVSLDRRREREEARALLARLGTAIDPDALVGSLRIGEQQLVEIARALRQDVSILILDEPTSALSATEVDRLFAVIADLRAAGVAIVYISHRLEELLRIGDRITVLRDGRLVESASIADVSIDWIVARMLGGERATAKRGDINAGHGTPLLEVERLSVFRPGGAPLLDSVSLGFLPGQVTALYGLLGSGRTELLEAICGARPATGSVRLGGTDISGFTIDRRLAAGLQFVPEDRQADGLFANLSVGGNICVTILDRLARLGRVSPSGETRAVGGMIDRLGIKTDTAAAAIGALSGGNQQKVMIGRALMPGPRVLLLDEPSRGVDIGARGDILDRLRVLADQGIVVLFATSDIDEALLAADRIVVLAGGRVTADLDGASATESALVHAANDVRAHAA